MSRRLRSLFFLVLWSDQIFTRLRHENGRPGTSIRVGEHEGSCSSCLPHWVEAFQRRSTYLGWKVYSLDPNSLDTL
ncbi:hypothetical protein AUEXF2481DRAFT_44394, partial [Aureobasidium subglaciale EXF-2481]